MLHLPEEVVVRMALKEAFPFGGWKEQTAALEGKLFTFRTCETRGQP
jgi:hypothetical protein